MSESENYSLNDCPPSIGDLELPDWSGMLPGRANMPADQWLAYCKAQLPRLKKIPRYAERRREQGIPIEFVL
ncbi:MAG TPA: hypothetical protein VK530_10970 [Candidatus Acidoferrum sp.]|nr:hypothetical protein [Candidatus Acidoferrum sp.]